MILTVDLAAKFSAVVVCDLSGKVVSQFDSFQVPPLQFSKMIVAVAQQHPDVIILVEDVPYGISRQAMIKAVLRLQGVIMSDMADVNLLDQVYFLNPSTWQRHFEGVFRGGPEGAAKAATALGYTPPNLLEDYADKIPDKGPERSKIRAQLKKATTDYVDAFLMAKWAVDVLIPTGNPPKLIAGVQPPMI